MSASLLDNDSDTNQTSERAKSYKNLGKHEDLRRKRVETSVEIRQQRRNDEMMKRRNISAFEDDSDSVQTDIEEGPTVTTVKDATLILRSNPSVEEATKALENIRRQLSKSKNPPIDDVISSGVLDILIKALQYEDEKIQFEAAWSLTNIVSGTSSQTLAVINAGASKPLLNLCLSKSNKLSEQALWTVANILGDSAELRDVLINQGFLDVLAKISTKLDSLDLSFQRTISWTISNLCRHKSPQVSLNVFERVLPIIVSLLKTHDVTLRQDGCWALSYITDGPDSYIEMANTPSIVNEVFLLASSNVESLIIPAIRFFGNFASGNDSLTQVVVECGLVHHVIPKLFKLKNNQVTKECCWLVSNILAGTHDQIQAVVEAGILRNLVRTLEQGDHRGQSEAAWALANLVYGGFPDQILKMCRLKGCVPAICSCLTIKSNEMVRNLLETLYCVLLSVSRSNYEEFDELKLTIEDCGGLDIIERLQETGSERIYQLSSQIIEEFFGEENEEIQETVSIETSGQARQFEF